MTPIQKAAIAFANIVLILVVIIQLAMILGRLP